MHGRPSLMSGETHSRVMEPLLPLGIVTVSGPGVRIEEYCLVQRSKALLLHRRHSCIDAHVRRRQEIEGWKMHELAFVGGQGHAKPPANRQPATPSHVVVQRDDMAPAAVRFAARLESERFNLDSSIPRPRLSFSTQQSPHSLSFTPFQHPCGPQWPPLGRLRRPNNSDSIMSHDFKLPRPRTDVPEIPSKSKNRDRSHSYLHRRLHASTISGHRHHDNSHHRFRFPDTVQSAIELKPPISFDQVLRRDKKSPVPSRRGSSAQQQRDINEWRTAQRALAEEAARNRVRREDVVKARAENDKREEVLQSHLKGVETTALDSTRQLDDTYYSILEKVSLLRSTVKSLQWLAEESKQLRCRFEEETDKMARDTSDTLDSVTNYDRQEQAINDLLARLKSSQADTNRLNDRLDTARDKVRAFEEKQNVLDTSRRRQWQATGAIIFGILIVVLAIYLFRNYDQVAEDLDGAKFALRTIGERIGNATRSDDTTVPPLDPHLEKLFDGL